MAEKQENSGEVRQDDDVKRGRDADETRRRRAVDKAVIFLSQLRAKAGTFVMDTVAPAAKKGAESVATVVGAAADSATESFGEVTKAAKGYFTERVARAEKSPDGNNVFADFSSAVLKYCEFLTKEGGFQKEEAEQAVHDRVDDILKNTPKKGGWWS